MSDLIALLDATLRLISNNGTDKKKLSKLPVSGVKPGGYPVDMFLDCLSDDEKENYQCGICFLITKNPCHCLNKHQFCRSCVTVWAGSGDSENHNKCPVCRVKGYYLPSGKVADALNAKTVHCLLRSCVWTGQLRDMQYHRHILSKKIAAESHTQIHRKNSDSSDDSSESDTCVSEAGNRNLSPSSSPVLPRIVTNGDKGNLASSITGLTVPTAVCSSGREREETPSSPSHATFLQMLHSASSSVDVPPRSNPLTNRSTLTAAATNTAASAEVAHEVRCHTPRPHSPTPTPTLRLSPQVPISYTATYNNSTTASATASSNSNNNNTSNNNNNNNATAVFPVRQSYIQNTVSENIADNLTPSQPGANYCRSSNRRTGPKEYERLRARMRETRVRLEQMEITRRELARFQERQRLQHLVEVRELGRQLNEVTFQIRRLLNQMSATDDQNTGAVATARNNNRQ